MRDKVFEALDALLKIFAVMSCAMGTVWIFEMTFGHSDIVSWIGKIVGVFLALLTTLSFLHSNDAERDIRYYRSEAEKYERLYWTYEAKCRALEKERGGL